MPASPPAAASGAHPRPAARDRREAVVAGGAAFAVLVAWSPALAAPSFSVRAALLLVIAGAGLPVLVRSVARRRLPEALGAALALWAAVSAARSADTLAWVGAYPLGTGAAFVAVLAVVYALGRSLPERARATTVTAVVAAASLNAAVGLLQVSVDLGIDELGLIDQRASGLLGNPVFLGGVATAGFVLAARPVRRMAPPSPPPGRGAMAGRMALLIVLAAGAQVSGTRIALAILVVSVAILAAIHRDRAAAWVAMAAVLGFGGGIVLSGLGDGAQRPAVSATQRLTSSGGAASGLGERLEVWGAGLSAFADRPLTGYGPGRFQPATSPRQTLDLALDAGPTRVFDDAHNVVVEHLATTGAVGAALLGAWGVAAAAPAARGRRWHLAVAAGGLAAFHLLEPQNVATTPLLVLLAGMAGTAAEPRAPARPPVRPAAPMVALGAAAALAGLVAGAVLVIGDADAKVAALDFDPVAAERAARLLRPWAAPAALEARIGLFDFRADDDPGGLRRALDASAEALDREPRDPAVWLVRARVVAAAGEEDQALAAYRRILELHPWSTPALEGRADLLAARGDEAAAGACRHLAALVGEATTGAGTRNGSGRSRSRSVCLQQS